MPRKRNICINVNIEYKISLIVCCRKRKPIQIILFMFKYSKSSFACEEFDVLVSHVTCNSLRLFIKTEQTKEFSLHFQNKSIRREYLCGWQRYACTQTHTQTRQTSWDPDYVKDEKKKKKKLSLVACQPAFLHFHVLNICIFLYFLFYIFFICACVWICIFDFGYMVHVLWTIKMSFLVPLQQTRKSRKEDYRRRTGEKKLTSHAHRRQVEKSSTRRRPRKKDAQNESENPNS